MGLAVGWVRSGIDPIEVVSQNFIKGPVRVRVINEGLFKMQYLLVEYVEV